MSESKISYSQSQLEQLVRSYVSAKFTGQTLSYLTLSTEQDQISAMVMFKGNGQLVILPAGMYGLLKNLAAADGIVLDADGFNTNRTPASFGGPGSTSVTATVLGDCEPVSTPVATVPTVVRLSLDEKRVKELLSAEYSRQGHTLASLYLTADDKYVAKAEVRRKLRSGSEVSATLIGEELYKILASSLAAEGTTVDPATFKFSYNGASHGGPARCYGSVTATELSVVK
ncbi:MAG TPA: hypothetical protein V6C81_19315 [Planktothrix sp.]|jgi:hypothetical protein